MPLSPATVPMFGGFYRVNIKDRQNNPIAEPAVLENVCAQLNNSPADEYPMGALKQSRLGIEHWRAVLLSDKKGTYIGMVADDRNQRAEQEKRAELEVEQALAQLETVDDFADALDKPKKVEDLSEFDKLEILMAEGVDADEAMKLMKNVPDEWYASRLPQPEAPPEVKIMRNDLQQAREAFEAAHGDIAEDDADAQKAFDATLAEKLAARPYLNSIDVEWKGVGAKSPFGTGSPFGTVVF